MSHMRTGVIVFAADEKEAHSTAADVFLEIVSHSGGHFDYYHLPGLDEEESVVHRLDTPEGGNVVQDFLATTKVEFMRHLESMKKELATLGDDELFDPDAGGTFQWHCYNLGATRSEVYSLYDYDSCPIQDKRILKKVVEIEKGSLDKDDPSVPWVVIGSLHS